MPSPRRVPLVSRLPALLLLAVAAVLAAPGLRAQPFPVHVEMHGGTAYDAEATRVEAWGFWLTDRRGVRFQDLDHVATPSDSFRALVVAAVPAAQVTEDGGRYTIRFDGVAFARREPSEPRLHPELAFVVGPTVGSRFGVETALTVQTPQTGPLVLQLGHQIGWNEFGHVGGATVGLGARVPVGRGALTVLANGWAKYASPENVPPDVTAPTGGPRAAQSAYSLSVFAELPLSEAVGVQAGVRTYVDDVELVEPASPHEALLLLRVRM